MSFNVVNFPSLEVTPGDLLSHSANVWEAGAADTMNQALDLSQQLTNTLQNAVGQVQRQSLAFSSILLSDLYKIRTVREFI